MRAADRRLLAVAGVAAGALAAAIGLGLATAVLAVAQAWLLAHSIAGAFLGGRTLASLAGPLIALAAVLAARAALGWGGEVVAQRISSRAKSSLRTRVLERAVELGPRWSSEARSGELVLLATRGLDSLDGYFGRYLPQVGLAVIVPVAVVVCLAGADLLAAVTVLLTVPLIPLFMILIGRASAAERSRRWAALSRLAHRFLDVVAGLPTLRAYGRADAQVAGLRRSTDAYRRGTMATLRVAFLSALALELLATISVALVAVGVGLRLVEGGLTLQTGLFVLVLAPEAYLPLRRLGAEFHASEEGLAAAAAAFDVLDAPPLPSGGRTDVPSLAGGRLVVERLSVRAPGRDALAPFEASLEVAPGEIVGVVGRSGAGKSTLLLGVLGLVEPTDGRVLLVDREGRPTRIDALDGTAWRRRAAWLPQQPFMFAGTVADNVRLGLPGASAADIRAGLDRLGLTDLALDHQIGERGTGLSSGQRRRIGLARALLRAAPLLLLDEPTAGLDAASEALVLEAIRAEASRGAAVILVAHRPAAAAFADRVVTIDWRADVPAMERDAPLSGAGVTGAGVTGAGDGPGGGIAMSPPGSG